MSEDEKMLTDTQMNNENLNENSADSGSLEVDEGYDSTQSSSEEYAPSNHHPAEKIPDVTLTQQSVAPAPAQQPVQAIAEAAIGQKPASPNTPGVLILQWLTYAFWGWTLVALYWLTSLSVQYFVSDSRDSDSYSTSYLNDMLAYSLAAVVVLFAISIICDIVYSRFEPRRKSGAAMVIMIIHAVIFALCSIGSLIAAVFAVVNMLISGGNEGASTILITAGIMTLLYAATLVRTLHPEKVKNVTKLFWFVMLSATVLIGGLGIFGPVADAQRTKDDRAIETALPNIAAAVNDYTDEQGKLPSSLKNSKLLQSYSIDSDEDAKRLIEDELVTYVAKERLVKPVDDSLDSSGVSIQSYQLGENKAVYHYQLCVTYDAEKNGRYDYDSLDSRLQKYETRPDTSNHSAGEVCYDLQTDYTY